MNTSTLPVLLVDDESHVLAGSESVLRKGGIANAILCDDPKRVMGILSEQEVGVLVLDLWMPNMRGEEVLALVVSRCPEVPVIVMTGSNTIETAVECMRAGAFDYLVKPVESSHLLAVVRRALELRELRRDFTRISEQLLTDDLRHPEAFADIVTRAPNMRKVFQYVETVAPSARPLLLVGETGTGKELLARAVHEVSGRQGNFVPVNLAGVDDTALSDTLFGHLKGAYTGAESSRDGLIERARGGTLFLDEIGDLSEDSQVKLLRLFESGEYYPLGSDMPRKTDARIVAATNRELKRLQESGRFRRDLFYRLSTHHLRIPPLRERMEDIPLLVAHLLEKAASELGKRTPTAPQELVTLLRTYHFPGNVRELEALILDAVSHHSAKKLSLEPIKERLYGEASQSSSDGLSGKEVAPDRLVFSEVLPTVDEAVDLLMEEALRRSDGNQTIAARLLGVSRTTLGKRLKRRPS